MDLTCSAFYAKNGYNIRIRYAISSESSTMDDLPCPIAGGIEPLEKPRFTEMPRIDNPLAWGVWDRHRKCWAERPCYFREAAERLARTMGEVHDAGAAEGRTGT